MGAHYAASLEVTSRTGISDIHGFLKSAQAAQPEGDRGIRARSTGKTVTLLYVRKDKAGFLEGLLERLRAWFSRHEEHKLAASTLARCVTAAQQAAGNVGSTLIRHVTEAESKSGKLKLEPLWQHWQLALDPGEQTRPQVANMQPGLRALRSALKQTVQAGAGQRKKGQTIARIVGTGFREFACLKALLDRGGIQQDFSSRGRTHLLFLYEYLGACGEATHRLRDFLECGLLIDSQESLAFLQSCYGSASASVTGAIEFAQSWIRARTRHEGAAYAELHYAHIAAFDYLAVGLVKRFAPEYGLAAGMLIDTIQDIPNARFFYKSLSSSLPRSFMDSVEAEVPDIPPEYDQLGS
jgi:hypothetical protein